MSSTGLVLSHVRKVFQAYGTETVAVDDFDMTIKRGEFLTLLGPSGCGKTTTLRIIAGFEIPTSGRVILEGKDITHMPPNKRNISMVFQSYALFPHLTVEGNIAFGLRLLHLRKSEIRERIKGIIALVGLEGLERRRPDQLSGGQQQRVALARSLVMKPSVLLFDEPLSNLDAKLRESMRLEIRRIQREVGITSVYVTHDQTEAMSISDRIVVMQDGRVMQVGSPFEVYARPRNAFVADFIGRVNLFTGTVEEVGKDWVRLRLDGATLLVEGQTDSQFAPGERALAAVRPESFSIDVEGQPNSISGCVKSRVFLGSHVEYEVALESGRRVTAVMFNPIEGGLPEVEEEISLHFSRTSVWVLKP